MQIKLHRIAISPGSIEIPMLAASSEPLPSKTLATLYPKTLKLAISLPGANPLGIVSNIPQHPKVAILSIFGLCATCKGVLFPNVAMGSSAIPSPSIMIYFILLCLKIHSILDSTQEEHFLSLTQFLPKRVCFPLLMHLNDLLR